MYLLLSLVPEATQLLLMRVAPKFFNYVRRKQCEKSIDVKVKDVKGELSTLEKALVSTENAVYGEKKENWKVKWETLRESENTIKSLSSAVRKPITKQDKTFEKRKGYMHTLEVLKDAIKPVYKAVTGAKKSKNHQDISAINEYLDIIREFADTKSEDLLKDRLDSLEKAYANTGAMQLFKENRVKKIGSNVEKVDPVNYLTTVYSKISRFIPDYTPSPEASLLDKPNKWRTKISRGKNEVSGKYGRFWSKLEIKSSYMEKESTADEISKLADKSSGYTAYCVVLPEVSDEFRQFVNRFQHNSMGLFAYDLKSNEIVCNPNDTRAGYFEGYFNPENNPKKLRNLIMDNATDIGLVEKAYVEELGVNEKLARRMGLDVFSHHEYIG